jgi:hypothetical protein
MCEIIALIWSIGGIIGGVVTAMVVRAQDKTMLARNVRAVGIVLGWIMAFVLGGWIGTLAAEMSNSAMFAIVDGPILWGWSVVPQTIGWGVVGGTVGAIGGKVMFLVLEEIW